MSFNIKNIKPAAVSVDPQPAAKHFDIILGLDFHLLLIPPSPAPIPFPVIPFGALVFDPMDYIHVTLPAMPAFVNGKFTIQKNVPMGGTVLINGFYRAAATSGLMGMPPTVPPIMGKVKALGSMVKKLTPLHMVVPKTNFYIPFLAPHDGQVSHGSKTVWTQGNEQSTLMCGVFSCAHVGRIVLNNPMGFFNNYATAIIGVLPMGKPVMVGGAKVEHTFKLDDLLNSLMFMGIMFAAKMIMKLLGKLLTKLNKFLCEKFPKFRKIGAAIQPLICKYLGEPVDPGTGHMTSYLEGFSLPGPIPFVWDVNYYSDSTYDGPLGKNIYHSYDISLVIIPDEGCVVMNDTAGRAIAFPTLTPGNKFYNPAEKYELHRDVNGEYFVVTKAGLYYYFNKQADRNGYRNIRSIANRNGYAIRFEYNKRHVLQEIIDSAGRNVKVESDASGRITALNTLHPDGSGTWFSQVRYTYDGEGCLTTAHDADGYKNSFSWQKRFIVSRTFPDSTTFTFQYDVSGKCIAALGPNGLFSYTFEYFEDHTVATNSLGFKSLYFHDGGIVTRIINPLGGQRYFRYDDFFNLVAETDENGITRTFDYDDRGNITAQGLPAKGMLKATFNHQDKLVKKVLPNGAAWQYDYDDLGNLTKIVNPEGFSSYYQSTDGLLTEVTNIAGAITRLEYDRECNIKKVQFPNGAFLKYDYDLLGRCISVRHTNGGHQARRYDLRNNITKVFEADGNERHIVYDAMRNPVHLSDRHTEITYRYNFFGGVKQRTEGKRTICYLYDAEGNLTGKQNEADELYLFELDALGDTVKETAYDGSSKYFTRDAGRRVVKTVFETGNTVMYDYNAAGQVIKTLFSDGVTEQYEYDALGLMTKAENHTATIDFKRDLMGRIIEEQCDGKSIKHHFNSFGRIENMTSSLGASVQVSHSETTGLEENLIANGWQAVFKRDVNGKEVSRKLPGEIELLSEYNDGGKLVRQKTVQRNGIHHNRKYIWDVDKLTGVNDSSFGTKVFIHDACGNLSEVIYGDNYVEFRMPDPVGNLFETKERRDREYTKGSRLVKRMSAIYKYNVDGKLIEKIEPGGATWEYHWNSAGMLEKVTRPDRGQIFFAYDALGRRVSKFFKKTTTRYLWNGNKLLHEWKEFGKSEQTNMQLTTWIFSETDLTPIAKIKGDQKFSIVSDHIGTPIQAYDEAGDLIWERELDSFGRSKMLKGEQGFCNYLYPGQIFDTETGLAYNRFRYYSPEEGIYISPDPIGLAGNNPTLYGYVKDPTMWIDPFGLAACHTSGDKGRAQAKKDIENAGLVIIGEEVTLDVKGKKGSGNIRADFVAVDPVTGDIHVFEAKNGNSGYTPNQGNAGVFDDSKLSNASSKGGALDLSQGQSGTANVATGNTTKTDGMQTNYTNATGNQSPSFGNGSTQNPTFHTLWYDV